ncbi:hypothetical protein CDD80_2958 [Ophiocordyceps camponoti-rufipedis]|uniref:LIM zinc-binding domain-containing protein n=1 Tax=Ophiocordyceps camponoti-rufipedis TaxID=2004952 RepID=A0A2C5Z0V6_9HYPO|nr:hypothetical protein CDD80_2958 [Ophiocordyceps camponoti-rufipedis]
MTRSFESKSRRMAPPAPAYMTNDQFAKYLEDLRASRTSRPGGARPQPSRQSQHRQSLDAASQSTTVSEFPSQAPSASTVNTAARSRTGTGRDYYPSKPTVPLKPSEVVPTATYMERGQRWMEKEEAVSLREAMQEMDIRRPSSVAATEDESRLYNAALDEAAELVWQHQHGAPQPKPEGPYRYRSHLRKNSYAHARTASLGSQGDEVAPSGLGRDVATRSLSLSSTDSAASTGRGGGGGGGGETAEANQGARPQGVSGTARRRTSLKKDISGEIRRPFSGDQIWEEPETSPATHNTAYPGRASPEKLDGNSSSPVNRARIRFSPVKGLDRVEIHRNPITQTRNPQYTTNGPSSKPGPKVSPERRNGVEVRGQDIRAATSRRLKDRSAKLPEPTAVSDSPGRPIVSFDAAWKAPDEPTDVKPDQPLQEASSTFNDARQSAQLPRIAISEAETHQVAGLPSIAVAGPDDDDVIAPEEPDNMTGRASQQTWSAPRPLPTPAGRLSQLQPQPRGHWSPAPGATVRPKTAVCHQCGLSIEGRFVSLAGGSERFHPQCFRCFSCRTSLETMEISPEPEHVRAERIGRIRARAAGHPVEHLPGKTAADDGDERLRFFCHLDWHELFAPRCKHCKTPIIGEHIVALGSHWHYGHFFCAECGDSFGHGMTHIEKDGYAWCVNCQTKRTERRAPKCRKCRQPVIGQYIQALGGEWHDHCFRCAECQGAFEDGQIYPKDGPGGTIAFCTKCRARQLKS